MANNELSTEVRELNKKLNTSIIEIMAKVVMDPDTEIDSDLINPMIEMYKAGVGYMELFAKILEQQESLNEKMNKALDIYIRKEGA